MTKSYCWDCHQWIDEKQLEECKKLDHTVELYDDDFDPLIGKKT